MCRELFLLQYRAAAKAQHFRLLLTCLLPVQIVEPYFQRCIHFQGGGLLESPVAQQVQRAGVLFMAIDAFDTMAISLPPLELIQFLNRLFTALDSKCEEVAGLTKVETVGEVYVVASGLFAEGEDDENANVSALATFALQARLIASQFGVDLRMGLHCGPIVAGIIGDKLPRFRLFGDTMNYTARLEQHCPPAKLLCSASAAELLRADSSLRVVEHGTLAMKGIGEVPTFRADFTSRPGTHTLASLLQSQSSGSLSVHSFPLPEESSTDLDSSPNLQQFLMDLPELDIFDEGERSPQRARSTDVSFPPLISPISPSRQRRVEETCPLMSPIWTHLERGLSDPECIAVERSTPPLRPFLAPPPPPPPPLQQHQQVVRTKSEPLQAPPRSASALLHPAEIRAKQDAEGTPISPTCAAVTRRRTAPPETPTSWLSPGRQLPPRSRSVFEMVRSVPTPLPRIREQQIACDEDPSQDQLDELRRRADAACSWQWPRAPRQLLGMFGGCQDCFWEACLKNAQPAIQRGCLWGSLGATCHIVLLLMLQAPWATVAASMVSAALLVACRAATSEDGRSPVLRWLLLHLAPMSVAGVLACPSPLYLPPAARFVALWSWLVGAMHAELPCTVMLAPTCLAVVLHSGPGLASLGALSQGFAIAALVVVALMREGLARRSAASETICSDVLLRLKTVAEDLLPPAVVAEVRSKRFGAEHIRSPGRSPAFIVHSFDVVSVLQTDLVGFTALARTKEAEDVLRLLNGLFGLFDGIVSEHDVFKMETVGDAYICATGLPDFAGGQHRPQALLGLAVDFHAAVLRNNRQKQLSLGLRAGLHTGPAIGGVVGTTMQRYHLFGGTMHIAETLEATSPPGAVHLSEAARGALATLGEWPPRSGRQRLDFSPAPLEQLQTSKGEHVPQYAVGDQATFVVWPPEAQWPSAEAAAVAKKGAASSISPGAAASGDTSGIRQRVPGGNACERKAPVPGCEGGLLLAAL